MPDTLGERKTSNVNKGLLASPSLSLWAISKVESGPKC
jgi:hypothetical protein